MFWGAGVTLRFLLILWVPVALGISDNKTPTLLNALVAIGILPGAWLAARLITLRTVAGCMPVGILIGVAVSIFALQTTACGAWLLLLIIGISGGFFVVPLNALLQGVGRDEVGAGNAIAVQNLGENTAMLMMLGLYSLAIKLGVPPVATGISFGMLFTLTVGSLWLWRRRQSAHL
ncbi:MFS transporter, LPLT family, lysophospholipid transporter [Izhakiella capsodis]|uniref:MFS transporter, LPLT family, lysophospholipid transporter n=1 Tax=Izhakiella capsodis TaxID=1367852 RepID=A0A1I4W6A4_9GAMM|nr:MFS transporter, LPLT family, lysophospholipid transporter [Izhakiella capsodis]